MTNRADLLRHYRREARRELWRMGRAAEYLLDTSGSTGGQQQWLTSLTAAPPMTWTAWEIGRQRGKTFASWVWDIQQHGLELQRGEVTYSVYLAQTGANAYRIAEAFLKSVSDELPPEWGVRFVDGEVRFANDSKVYVHGTDNEQYRRARGNPAKRVRLDEAGFYSALTDVEAVYTPQLSTTGGTGLYLSSPALTPGHTFSARCDAAKAVGRYVHDTYANNPRVNKEALVRAECERLGMTREELMASSFWRREYEAQRVMDENRAAVPSWTPEAQAELVREWPMPMYFDGYEAHDAGVTGDPHASLFGCFDPASNTLLITHELERRSAITTIASWVEDVKAVEREVWGVTAHNGGLLGLEEYRSKLDEVPEFLRADLTRAAPTQPFLRVGDEAQGICRDMTVDHHLPVLPTAKHNKAMVADLVAQLVADRRLRIHSRCKRLLMQLNTVLWDASRRRWERTETDHGDLIDCLLYIVRAVRWHRDCRPKVVVDPMGLRPQAKQGNYADAVRPYSRFR